MAPFFNRLALEDREREGGKGEGRGERGEERKKTTATEEGAGVKLNPRSEVSTTNHILRKLPKT